MSQPLCPELQVCKSDPTLWRPKYLHRTYSGPIGAPGCKCKSSIRVCIHPASQRLAWPCLANGRQRTHPFLRTNCPSKGLWFACHTRSTTGCGMDLTLWFIRSSRSATTSNPPHNRASARENQACSFLSSLLYPLRRQEVIAHNDYISAFGQTTTPT